MAPHQRAKPPVHYSYQSVFHKLLWYKPRSPPQAWRATPARYRSCSLDLGAGLFRWTSLSSCRLLAQSVRQSHRTQLRASTCSHGAEVSCLQDKPLAFHGIFLFRISPKDPRSQLWHCCPCSAVSSRPQTMVAAGRGKCHGNKPAWTSAMPTLRHPGSQSTPSMPPIITIAFFTANHLTKSASGQTTSQPPAPHPSQSLAISNS